MKKFFPVLIIFSALFLYGCNTISYYADYKISLSQVERPMKAVQVYGNPRINDVFNDAKYKYCFEDSLIKISMSADSRQIIFLFANKTNQTIKIPWDEAAYVDEDGFTHRVIHSSIDFADKEKPQPPSVIVRKSQMEESIIPSDFVKWIDSGGEHSSPYWNVEPFLVENIAGKGSKENIYATQADFLNAVKLNIGKEFQVLLPLEVKDVTYEYIFTFKVDDVKVNKK